MHFNDVKVLIWDFDGTLYKPNENLFALVREAEYKVIANHTGWDRERAKEEFHKLYKVTMQSATAVSAKLSGISIPEAAVEVELYYDRRDFLSRDEKLISMFASLKTFRHFMLANGLTKRHKETLEVLGVPFDTFEAIVTSETVGVTKPNPKGFMYIMHKTGYQPSAHMMIGDRELVDLAPAKSLGMHTCYVWSQIKSHIADVTLPTVYDVPHLFDKGQSSHNA